MKKLLALSLSLIMLIGLLAGCGNNDAETTATAGATTQAPTVIKVGASPTPHAEILEAARDELLKLGYDLQIVDFTDYIQPNVALESGDLDANYFQHEPYLDNYNENNGTDLVAMAYIHYEPLGIYAGKTASIEDLKDGAQIAVSNDGSNEARALLLLEAQGLIKLDPNASFNATVADIVDNPHNYDIKELEAAQVPRSLADVDLAVINGNYAIDAGLNAETDALAKEEKSSESAVTYANIIAINAGDEGREDLKALVKALTSEEVRTFIETEYKGAVVASF